MKKIILLSLMSLLNLILFSQNIEPAPNDKSVVYFTRANTVGALINFTYFDGEKVIGKFNGPKYIRYECIPGEHLFWARSENKSFIEANLEAGKIYIIDVVPKMGAIKASVSLVPVNSKKYKLKQIQKLLSKRDSETFNESQLNELQVEMNEIIIRGMEKYNQLKGKEREILQLTPEMTVSEEDLIFTKKA
ncbi:MAG: hypothetical protein WAV86_08455 [Lutibacter sp.]